MTTKYDRISADLRRKIRDGHLAPGERMPAETALRDVYGVSLLTMRRALDVLAVEGLIERRQGLGNFVRTPRQRVRRTNERYQWEKARALLPDHERGREGTSEHDTGLTLPDLRFSAEYKQIDADDDLAEAFAVAVGTRLLRRTYRTASRDEVSPLSVSRSHLVLDMIEGNPALLDAGNEPWPGGTYHQLRTVGIEIDRIMDEITARPPTRDEAEELGAREGVSLLVMRKTAVDTGGRVVDVADVLLAGDRTELVYSTALPRWPR